MLLEYHSSLAYGPFKTTSTYDPLLLEIQSSQTSFLPDPPQYVKAPLLSLIASQSRSPTLLWVGGWVGGWVLEG
jgi:hypothetical protein